MDVDPPPDGGVAQQYAATSPTKRRRSSRRQPEVQFDDGEDTFGLNPYERTYEWAAYQRRLRNRPKHTPPPPKPRPRRHAVEASADTSAAVNLFPDDENGGTDVSSSDDAELADAVDGAAAMNVPVPDPDADLTGQYIEEYVEIPDEPRRIMSVTLDEDWYIKQPRDIQWQGIYHGAFFDGKIIRINAKTGEGKSVIPLATGTLRKGITVIMEPLLAVGSDQVAKAIYVDKNIEAYHGDEHVEDDEDLLMDRLRDMTQEECDNLSIILFLSPRLLKEKSKWTLLLKELAAKNFISVLCIDEAHTVAQQKNFRPEFTEAVKTIKQLADLSPTAKPPRFLMSATFRDEDMNVISDLWDKEKPDVTLWTCMSRRRIFLHVEVSGNPTLSARHNIEIDLKQNPNQKVVWYTNSKKKAEESLVPTSELLLDSLGIDGEAFSCTGGDGVKHKSYALAAWSGKKEHFVQPDRSDIQAVEGEKSAADIKIPKLSILTATDAANCGISSDECHSCTQSGPCDSMYSWVQKMGRVDRDRSLPPGSDRFEMHMSWPNLISWYVRCMQQPDADERKRQQILGLTAMRAAITPGDECMHVLLERYFEKDTTGKDKKKCGQYCCVCTGEHKELTGKLQKEALVNVVVMAITSTPSPDHNQFLAAIKDNKDKIWAKGEFPGTVVAPMHAVCLQLWTKGIIDLFVPSDFTSFVGTDKLLGKHVRIRSGRTKNKPIAAYDDSCWEGITFRESAPAATTEAS